MENKRGVTSDRRKASRCGADGVRFVCFLDNFMSGWSREALLPDKSYYCLEVTTDEEEAVVRENGANRSEMRYVGTKLMPIHPGTRNHTAVVGPSEASRWYVAGAFKA